MAKVKRKCERCGVTFLVRASGKGRFCSPKCSAGYGPAVYASRAAASREERFWARVSNSDQDACWLWTGPRSSTGYGTVSFGRGASRRIASRVAYEYAVGPIPEGMLVCHHCDTPLCCNPKHLFVGTQDDNMKDMAAKKTTCIRGHLFTPENTVMRKDGSKTCRECKNARERSYLQQKRAA